LVYPFFGGCVGLGGCVGVGTGVDVDVEVAVGWGVGVDVAVGGTSVAVDVDVDVGDGGTCVGVRVGGSTRTIVGVSVGSAAMPERPSCRVSTLLQTTVHRTMLTTTRPMAIWRRREDLEAASSLSSGLGWPVPLLAMPIVSRRTLQEGG